MVASFVVSLAAAAAVAVAAEGETGLTGTWTLDERSSDDPVQELRGRQSNGEPGKQVVRGISIFGVPVGELAVPPDTPDADDDEEDEAAADAVRGVEHVFESTFRLTIQQGEDVTEIRYGAGPSMIYRHASRAERDGAVVRADWQDERLSVEHELADGARVSERYWVDARSGELNWTVRLKRDKQRTVDVKRILYRTPTAE
jgi:hypothetical protein